MHRRRRCSPSPVGESRLNEPRRRVPLTPNSLVRMIDRLCFRSPVSFVWPIRQRRLTDLAPRARDIVNEEDVANFPVRGEAMSFVMVLPALVSVAGSCSSAISAAMPVAGAS